MDMSSGTPGLVVTTQDLQKACMFLDQQLDSGGASSSSWITRCPSRGISIGAAVHLLDPVSEGHPVHGWRITPCCSDTMGQEMVFLCLLQRRIPNGSLGHPQAQPVQGPSAMQCPAGLAAGPSLKAKEGSRTGGITGTEVIFPACSCIPLQVLPPLSLLEALLTPGVELAQICIDPRSCLWAMLIRSAIMHTSFHFYAKNIHPTRISTAFEVLCSLGRSGRALTRIHDLVLIVSSCWALERRAFSSRTTATRANRLLCYQEADPLQSAWRTLPCCRSQRKPSSATIGGRNSLTLQGRREHHQHHNCLPLVLLGRTPQNKRAPRPSQGISKHAVKVRGKKPPLTGSVRGCRREK